MGIKRRSMFNPKFKRARAERWDLGRKAMGVPTDKELEDQRLEEEIQLKAQQEAEAMHKAAVEHAMAKKVFDEEVASKAEESKKNKAPTAKKKTTTPRKKTARAKKATKG